jgi:AcrR family transcriptional regulator
MAALQLAQTNSPGAITTTDLAKALGLSQGALFKHFASKEAIWLAAMRWVTGQLLGTLHAAAEQAPGPMEALERVFLAHIDFVVANPGVPRVIFHELQQAMDSPVKQQVRSLMQGYRQLLVRLLGEAAQSGAVSAQLDIPAAATLFMGIVQGLVMQSMLNGQVAAMRTDAPRVFHLYLCGIRTSS